MIFTPGGSSNIAGSRLLSDHNFVGMELREPLFIAFPLNVAGPHHRVCRPAVLRQARNPITAVIDVRIPPLEALLYRQVRDGVEVRSDAVKRVNQEAGMVLSATSTPTRGRRVRPRKQVQREISSRAVPSPAAPRQPNACAMGPLNKSPE